MQVTQATVRQLFYTLAALLPEVVVLQAHQRAVVDRGQQRVVFHVPSTALAFKGNDHFLVNPASEPLQQGIVSVEGRHVDLGNQITLFQTHRPTACGSARNDSGDSVRGPIAVRAEERRGGGGWGAWVT